MKKLLTFAVVAGFLASVASYAFGPVTTLAVGASGAISGVFGAFIAYNYRRREHAMNAANLRLALTVIVLNAVIAIGYSSIDWRAHVGGLVAGFALGYLADSSGPARQRAVVRFAGVATLVVIGIALVLWRTAEIRSALPQFFG